MANQSEPEKVRCIDDHFSDSPENPFEVSQLELPEKGKVYTIRETVKTSFGNGIRLEEVRNKKYFFDNIKKYEEPIFGIERFETI